MAASITPMIHVPDIRSTVKWYTDIGFTLDRCYEEDGQMNWAQVSLGSGRVMFNIDGKASDAKRREVDLYIQVDDIDALFERVKNHAEVVAPPHDTFYGMREFIIRDANRFWITFGRPLA
jgi:uncharacterized glyoxalase superfamily protein PhnB